MSKLSKLVAQKKKALLCEQKTAVRKALKEAKDYLALDRQKKNSAATRLVNRCWSCGRPRGFDRFTGLCRICLRKKASNAEIPGMKKASW